MGTQTELYENEINLVDYWRVIMKHKMLICSIVGIVVAATIVVALLTTPIYEATAVIAPVNKVNEPSGVNTIAAQIGVLTPTSSNMSEIVNLLGSNVLKEEIIKKRDLLHVFFKGGSFTSKSESARMWMGVRYLQDRLKVSPNQKENSIRVSVQSKDPKLAADLVNYTLVELTEHMSSEARRVAEINRKYLESQIDKASDPFIRTRIYGLIAQQIETSMLAEVKENFAFKILDPPRVPDRKVKPKRTQMTLIAFVVSLFAGVLAAFGKECWDNYHGELKTQTNARK